MSILKSTHTGLKYYSWKEDLERFAKRTLELSRPLLKNPSITTREVHYIIPKYSEKTGKLGQEERWFRFYLNWSVDTFISEFKKQLFEDLKGTEFELEDVWIPKSHVIE